jgi:hypothetical protein
MANKRLKVGGGELKLSAKKSKEDKKPKWQAKTGKKVKVEPLVEVPVAAESFVDESPTLPPEPTETPTVATSTEAASVEPTTADDEATTPDAETDIAAGDESATNEEPTPKKPRKLKVQADLKPKKISMIKAALQVLQERKLSMTCLELIDVMATEGLWTSPGGKTPAATLYAALSRSIKDLGKASPFRKAERGKFEAKE